VWQNSIVPWNSVTENQSIKFQVTIHFEMDAIYMSLVPLTGICQQPHRSSCNRLLFGKYGNPTLLDHYECPTKKESKQLSYQISLAKYWTIEIDEAICVRCTEAIVLPALQMN
jgi:hypothetical protein